MPTARPLRADARRNRDRLVAVARAVLASGEPLALEAVAREAGLGIGTLYRHFPTREALVEEVYAVELDDLVAGAAALLDRLPPRAALREWMVRYARFATTKRGILDALRSRPSAGVSAGARERIAAAVAPILAAGAGAGSLRDDVRADDLTVLLLGVLLSTAATGDADQTERLLDLVLDS